MTAPEDFVVDEFDEWEVVNLKKTDSFVTNSTVSTKDKPKPTAKKEDIDVLSRAIENQLQIKNYKDEQNLKNLQNKIKEQQQMSVNQLRQIQEQLNTIVQLQAQQQQSQLMQDKKQESLIQRQSLLDYQLKHQQKETKNIAENLTSQLQFLPNLLGFGKNDDNTKPKDITESNEFVSLPPTEEKSNVVMWDCPVCNESSDESNRFCPKCGCKNDFFNGGLQTLEQLPFNSGNRGNSTNVYQYLKFQSMIGENLYEPNETRQSGWVLENKSDEVMNLNGILECIGGDKNIIGLNIKTEKEYKFTLQPNEKVYILIELTSPALPGKYSLFYQLITNDDGQTKIGDMLELKINVKPKFNKSKEDKIAKIVKMGFEDRKLIENSLQKHKWKEQQAVNELLNL